MAFDTEFSLMFFDEDIPFQALRQYAAAFWRMASSSSLCQWTLQMGDPAGIACSRSEEES